MWILIKVILKVLFWVLVGGIVFNYIMRFISYPFYKCAKRNGKMEETVQRIEIHNSLIGYVGSINFHEKKKVILYFGGSGEIAYNAVLSYAKLFNDYIIKQDYADTSHIVIMGYSYGTGIAAYLTSKIQ